MACFYPLDAWRTESGKVLLSYNPRYCTSVSPQFKIPCTRCVGCRLDRSRKWAVRCMHESQMHRDNCFITLTYDNKRLPERPDGVPPANISLYYPDFQLFMKRLRKRFSGKNIRFYMAGEYGEQCRECRHNRLMCICPVFIPDFGRPHFHACLFGLDFPDRDFFMRSPSGAVIYRSRILEELWPYGFSSVGNLDFQSAAYVARYCMKKITGDAADLHYETVDPVTGEVYWRVPEFNKMSLKPGIGATWFEKYHKDVFPHDHVIVSGQPTSVPRYYDKLYERMTSFEFPSWVVLSNGEPVSFEVLTASREMEAIKFEREERAKNCLDDNTPDRLRVKEQVTLANLQKLKRKLR